MFELVRAGERTYYVDGPSKAGIYLHSEGEATLVDSGSDKDAGRRILRILEEQGWALRYIVNTHSNADHIGGNRYLQQKTGCEIIASGTEGALIEHPFLEPSLLYGGFPCRELRNKFLMAQPSRPGRRPEEFLPAGLESIPLPGHFLGMIGLKTSDGVYFLADCLFSETILGKYHLFFVYDVASFFRTLEAVMELTGTLFVPAHAPAAAEIRPLARKNRDKLLEILRTILHICARPLCFEDILQRLFDAYGLTLDLSQYVLAGSTLRSCLSYLRDEGKTDLLFERNKLLWHARESS